MVKTLVADDIEKWHDVVRKNLNYFGFKELFHAYTIKEGLNLYEVYKPELVITDINFDITNPENLDGLILCEQIRERGKETKIVVMSTKEGLKEALLNCGADYFINKKYFKEEIEDFIRMVYPNHIR